jgi:biotin carboxylase
LAKRVLLVAATTGYQTHAFEEVARSLGLDVVFGIDRCVHLEGSWGKDAIPLRFEKPAEAAELLARADPKPDAIVAVGDKPAEIASLAAEALNLPFHPHHAVLASRNKFIARERFRRAGLPTPEYFLVLIDIDPVEAARSAPYPCVLKPLGLSGSRGVIRADDESGFCAAAERIRKLLESPEVRQRADAQDRFLHVEAYIPGREYAIEGVVTDGRLQVLAIFDKPDPLEGPFFEETLYVTPSREPDRVQTELAQAVQDGIRALGLTHGPVHAEARYNDAGAWLLEIAARPIGGLCAGSLRFGNGMRLEELILRHALGEDVTAIRREAMASGVMMIPIPSSGIYRGVAGLEEASTVPGITDVIITAKEGQRMLKLPEGASYLGFAFAAAQTPAAVEAALRKAHSRLQFRVAGELPLL